MEQIVWFYVGVIATFIALAVIASVFLLNTEEKKSSELDNAIQKFSQKASFVCSSDEGTLISEKILLPSGSRFFSQGNSICFAFNQEKKCKLINCPVLMETLALTDEKIKKTYVFHEFSCYFEKSKEGVLIECRG
jgi:hypothetical protein